MIAVNGKIVAQGSQFSLQDVEVVTATVDLEDVRAHRATSSRSMQAAGARRYERIEVDFSLSKEGTDSILGLDELLLSEFQVHYHKPEEEIACVVIVILMRSRYLSLVVAWDLLAGFGIISDDQGRKGTFSR